MIISYEEKPRDETVIIANRIGHLEIKAINKLVEDIELPKVIERYLSPKEQNIYYTSKYKLRELLLGECKNEP